VPTATNAVKEERFMDLLPAELRKVLPPLYSQESSAAPVVQAKFFTPDAGWTWLITEGSEQGDGDWLLFGYVIGLEEEWGYFLLSEIVSVRGPLRLTRGTRSLVSAGSHRRSASSRAATTADRHE
jgi:hypothetical protein